MTKGKKNFDAVKVARDIKEKLSALYLSLTHEELIKMRDKFSGIEWANIPKPRKSSTAQPSMVAEKKPRYGKR